MEEMVKLFNDGESYVKTIRIGKDTFVMSSREAERFKDQEHKIVLKKYRDGGSGRPFRCNIIFDSFEIDSSIPEYKDDVLHFDEHTISYVYDKFITLKKETLAGDSVIKYFIAKVKTMISNTREAMDINYKSGLIKENDLNLIKKFIDDIEVSINK